MKGAPARKHLVENRAKGKDVRTMIDRATLHLFGRHVADRSQYHAWISVDAASWYFSLRLAAVRLCEFRNAEVENLYATIFGDEDVVGLEIAMNDSFLMRGRQTAGDLARIVDRSTLCKRRPSHSLAHGLALEQLRDNIGRAIVRADVMHDEDVRMIERARGAGLLLESLQSFFVIRVRRRQNLDRDIASQTRVARAINFAHPASAEGS